MRIDIVPIPRPGLGEILIRNHSLGLNFGDLLFLRGNYLVAPRLPQVIGMEGAGTVVAVGRGVTDFAPGDRVGYIQLGAFADQIVVRESRAVRLPDGVDFDTAAPALVAGLTAWHLLHTMHGIRHGEAVVVRAAASNVGIAAVQIAKAAGAFVIGVTSSNEKAERVRSIGADAVIGAHEPFVPAIQRLTLGVGADVILDSVGGEMFDAGLDALAPFGHLVFFGQMAGAPPPLCPGRLVERSLRFSAFSLPMTYADRDRHRRALDGVFGEVCAGRLRIPIGQRMALTDAAKALRLMADRRATGKIILDAG